MSSRTKAKGVRPFILVLAGVNGAGKSSVGGALLQDRGLTWFNPDTYSRELVLRLRLPREEADARAWAYGRMKLEAAMTQGESYAFETTLGGKTIAALLVRAAATHDVNMIFVGLSSPELHLQRVRLRVAHGGHDIPEDKIRQRWGSSRINLVRLMPHLAHLQVFDNSAHAAAGTEVPDPVLLLETARGKATFPDLADTRVLAAAPSWARPILQAAVEDLQHS